MGGNKHLGREKLVKQLRKLAEEKGVPKTAKPNASRGKVIRLLVFDLSPTIVNLRYARWAPDTKVTQMVDLLLASTEGDAKAEVEVIYSQYEATFVADGLIGPPGEVEDAAGEGAADGGAVLEDTAVLADLFAEDGEGAAEEEEEEGPAGEAAPRGRGSFRLRGKSILFTFNWDFLRRAFPDGAPGAASVDALWELWRVWKREKKKEHKAALR